MKVVKLKTPDLYFFIEDQTELKIGPLNRENIKNLIALMSAFMLTNSEIVLELVKKEKDITKNELGLVIINFLNQYCHIQDKDKKVITIKGFMCRYGKEIGFDENF